MTVPAAAVAPALDERRLGEEARSPSPPSVLGPEERRRIGVRMGSGLVALGLLALGTVLLRLEPAQWQVGELVRAAAALVVGVPTLLAGLRGIVTGDPKRATDQLVAIAILAAAAAGDFVTATLVPLFLEIGRIFEDRSSLGARAAIDGIRALAARQAVRWENGAEERVDPNSLRPDDIILVRPGERVAADGIVVEGRAAIDPSAITGESLHQDVGPGSPVFAGTVALDGMLRVKVRGAGSDTVLGRVVKLLAEVERSSVPILRLFEKRAGVWLPLVLTLAATTLFFTSDLSRAIAVLVVATPTALVVAGPAAMVSAMTAATRLRLLIKSSDFLERASDVDTLILDKTGTVTVGAPSVHEVHAFGGATESEVLATAAACGFGSLHPVSRAVVAEARARGLEVEAPRELQEKPGLGVTATLDGGRAVLGRRALLEELGIETGARTVGTDDAFAIDRSSRAQSRDKRAGKRGARSSFDCAQDVRGGAQDERAASQHERAPDGADDAFAIDRSSRAQSRDERAGALDARSSFDCAQDERDGTRAGLEPMPGAVPPAPDGADDVSQVWVGLGARCLGRLVLRDEPRAEARDSLQAMRDLGINRLVLLTGDRAAVAREVGTALGMDEVISDVLPAQKLEVIRREQAAGRVVMMVGDGVNDAPALGGADVGVAIGAELDQVALGGADVALLGADLGRLPRLVRLADRTRQILGQNVYLAFGLSMVLIALAATGLLDPRSGALLGSAAVLVVVANGSRILALGESETR